VTPTLPAGCTPGTEQAPNARHRRGEFGTNVARLTNVPGGAPTARRTLSSDDAKKLLASATEDRLGAFVVAVLRERRVLQDEERAAAGALV